MAYDISSSQTRTHRSGAPADQAASWLRYHLRGMFGALIHSSAYLAVIAMAEVAIVMTVLSLPMTPVPLIAGLVTFAVYVNDRLADAEADAIAHPARAAFINRHRQTLYVLGAIAYGLAVAIAAIGGPLALALTLFPGAVWVAYAADVLPTLTARLRRVKEVLILNTVTVAAAWALPLTFLPLVYGRHAITPVAGLVFVYFFVGTFVNTEIPNVRDVRADQAVGVSTIPVAYGISRTRHALYAVNLLSAALLIGAVSAGVLSIPIAVALFIGIGYSLVVTSRVGRTSDYRTLTVVAEGVYLPVFAAIVAIGLPV